MQIGIDTTAAGADVGETVTAFPLLVRLDARNFAFAEARRDGADVRFLDSSGNNLAYEIERWNADKAVAEIWVLVPRIIGSSRNNYVLMYWGNPLSATTSSGPSVFGGYSWVFHMGEDPNNPATQFEDDSAQNSAGTLLSPTRVDSRVEGAIGTGLALDGLSVLTTARPLPSPNPVAIALWIKTQSSTGGGIAGFASTPASDADAPHDRFVAMDSSGRLSFSILRTPALATVTSLASYNDGQWHFVVARFSSSGQYLFVDGDAVADDPTMTSANSYPGYWRFGEEPPPTASASLADAAIAGNYFTGTIDEARISTDEPSDAWIKLSYATQRPDASTVIFPIP